MDKPNYIIGLKFVDDDPKFNIKETQQFLNIIKIMKFSFCDQNKNKVVSFKLIPLDQPNH
jgi:hypothetical protein